MPTIKPNPADNSEHEAHSYMSRESSNNAGVGVCFPSLHLFFNGNFELWKISGIDSKKKKKKDLFFKSLEMILFPGLSGSLRV